MPDTAILAALFQGTLDCGRIAGQLNVTQEEILNRIAVLQQLGYRIEQHPHRGYTLVSAPDTLIADEILARLPDNPFAAKLRVFRETDSTNNLVFKSAKDGAGEGFCVIAESQTKGKGRKGRNWQSAQGKGLWFSILLRPAWPTEQASRLTYLASVALCQAIEKAAGISCAIKWPNDVFINNKKTAGILTEIHSTAGKLDFAVLGIGCNINHDINDFPPDLQDKVTSLKMTGTHPNFRRADLLVSLLDELTQLYSCEWPVIYEKWKSLCLTIGKTVHVQTEQLTISGQMVGLEENGNLLLRLPDGRIQAIHTGDVLW